jgi:hypothetical protein
LNHLKCFLKYIKCSIKNIWGSTIYVNCSRRSPWWKYTHTQTRSLQLCSFQKPFLMEYADMGRNSQPRQMDELITDFAGHVLVSSRYPCHVLIDVPFVQCEAVINLLVLSREWMGMGERDYYCYSDYGSFPIPY